MTGTGRKRLYYFFFFVFFFSYVHLFAQVQHSGWAGSFNTFKLNRQWSVHFDAQIRSTDKLKHVQTLILRPGINYHLNPHTVLTGGYAYIPNRRTLADVTGYLAEHRIWEQIVYNHKIEKISTAHRLRFEQRFLPVAYMANNELKTDDYLKAYRLRYFIRNLIPLNRQPAFTSGVFFALQDEVFINTGNKDAVNGRTFDQNRLYLAFGYRLPHSKIDLEAGYMNQYIRGRNKAFTNNHIAQLAVYKRL